MNKFLGALIASAFLLTGTAIADQAKTSSSKNVAQAMATAKPAAKPAATKKPAPKATKKPAPKATMKPAPKATKKPAAMKPTPAKT